MFYKFYNVKEFKERSEYSTFQTNASIENKYLNTRTRAVFKENNM